MAIEVSPAPATAGATDFGRAGNNRQLRKALARVRLVAENGSATVENFGCTAAVNGATQPLEAFRRSSLVVVPGSPQVIENPMTFQVGWPIPNSDLVVNCNATGPNITIVTAEGRIQLSSTTPVVYVPCQPTITVLCAENGRFSVGFEAIALDGRVIPGQVRHGDQYPDGGFFYVPDLNIEALVKVLNACHLNDRFWVFASAVTDIEMNLTVTDTRTGVMQLYRNARGQPGRAVEDQNAFATCGQ